MHTNAESPSSRCYSITLVVVNNYGEAVIVKCFEDNSKVKELAGTAGNDRVLVIDGGGSLR